MPGYLFSEALVGEQRAGKEEAPRCHSAGHVFRESTPLAADRRLAVGKGRPRRQEYLDDCPFLTYFPRLLLEKFCEIFPD